MSIIKSGRAVAALAAAALLVATGAAAATVKPTSAPVAAAVSTSDILAFARNQLALCQVELHDAFDAGARQRAQNCITDAQRAIADLSRTPGPTPSPSASPTGAPTPTVVPTSASPSPTPAPTTIGPSPTPSPSPSPTSGGFPDASNTGVPAGTQLTAYTGPCTITVAGTVIDAKTVNCDLHITTSGVKISRSLILGSIGDDETDAHSFTLTDSEVSAGAEQNPAVWHTNFTVLRSNIHGGQTAVGCVDLCVVKDSWLHGQVHDPNKADQHFGGFLSNGGGSSTTPSLIQHNTIVCDLVPTSVGGGESSCSGAINLFGDFGPVRYYTFNNNLVVSATYLDAAGRPQDAESYCIYGGSTAGKPGGPGDHLVFTGNVMQHGTAIGDPGNGSIRACAYWGAVADWDPSQPGSVWSGNIWDDGTPLLPTRSGS